MDDDAYKIQIECDHGESRPMVARATYIQDSGWDVAAQRARGAKGSKSVGEAPTRPRPTELPPRQRAMYGAAGDARRPGAGFGDDETRQFITCTACGTRVLAKWPKLVRVLDGLRHADIHRLTLQQLARIL